MSKFAPEAQRHVSTLNLNEIYTPDYMRFANNLFKLLYGHRDRHGSIYAIAVFDLFEFVCLTGEVSDNYDELQVIYDKKYAQEWFQTGTPKYYHEIIEITFATCIGMRF